jgi:hypothetical protein
VESYLDQNRELWTEYISAATQHAATFWTSMTDMINLPPQLRQLVPNSVIKHYAQEFQRLDTDWEHARAVVSSTDYATRAHEIAAIFKEWGSVHQHLQKTRELIELLHQLKQQHACMRMYAHAANEDRNPYVDEYFITITRQLYYALRPRAPPSARVNVYMLSSIITETRLFIEARRRMYNINDDATPAEIFPIPWAELIPGYTPSMSTPLAPTRFSQYRRVQRAAVE